MSRVTLTGDFFSHTFYILNLIIILRSLSDCVKFHYIFNLRLSSPVSTYINLYTKVILIVIRSFEICLPYDSLPCGFQSREVQVNNNVWKSPRVANRVQIPVSGYRFQISSFFLVPNIGSSDVFHQV